MATKKNSLASKVEVVEVVEEKTWDFEEAKPSVVPTVKEETSAESRRSVVLRGMKEGAVRGAVDKVVEGMVGPIADKIAPAIAAIHPSAEVLEPAIRIAIEFIFMMGMAELVEFAAPMAGKALPNSTEEDAGKKGKLLALWMRKYAGEKVGQQIVDVAVSVVPVLMAHFADIKTADLQSLVLEAEVEEAQARAATN